MYDICHGLSVGRGPRPAAPDLVVHLRQLVRHAVGNVSPGRRARISAENDTRVKGDGHSGENLGSHKRRAADDPKIEGREAIHGGSEAVGEERLASRILVEK